MYVNSFWQARVVTPHLPKTHPWHKHVHFASSILSKATTWLIFLAIQQDLRVILYVISVGGLLVVYCMGRIGACVIYLGFVIPSECFRLQGHKWMHPLGVNYLFDLFFLRLMGNPQRNY